MGTRSGMGAFLENPMFLFVDDAEPILPIFRSTDYGDTGRIVELADVGCDTENTFPIYFPRGASDRRRGGAESLGSTRRIAKWLNNKPNEFARRATDVNNNEVRNRNYVRGKTWRGDYDDGYIADLDYDDSYARNPYDDLELSRNNSTVEENDDYYARFVHPRNAIARSRREHIPRYDYSRDLESSFTQDTRAPQRNSTFPRWFAENDGKNIHEMHDINDQPDERKKRTKILSKTNGHFNRKAEFEKTRETVMHGERDNLPNAIDSNMAARNTFWDFISFENDAECEETTFRNPAATKNHGRLQNIAPHRKRSYVFDSQPKRVVTVDSEEEDFRETLKKDRRENLSPEIPINNARHRILKGDKMKEKPKISRLNTPNAISSRDQAIKMPIDKRVSNMYPAEKNSINMKPHSATEGKKLKSQTIERKEIANTTRTIVDDRRYRDKLRDKLPNNSAKETSRSTRTFNFAADSKSNGWIHTANERDNTNVHRENSGTSKIDRIKVAVSRLKNEKEKITKNERTFALKVTNISASRTNMEEEKDRKFSRLPIRTWKRLRTKEPAVLRPDATNGDVNRKFQGVENETAKSNDHSERVENDDVRVKDRATANRNDVKRNGRFRTGSLSAGKPGLTFSDLKKGMKEIKGLNTAKGTHEQQKKKTNIKSTRDI